MEFKEIEKLIENFGKNHPTYWGCALCGEAGEAANLLKKLERGTDYFSKEGFKRKLGEELADVFNYVVLTARIFEIDLEQEIINKAEKIKEERGKRGKPKIVEFITGTHWGGEQEQ